MGDKKKIFNIFLLMTDFMIYVAEKKIIIFFFISGHFTLKTIDLVNLPWPKFANLAFIRIF